MSKFEYGTAAAAPGEAEIGNKANAHAQSFLKMLVMTGLQPHEIGAVCAALEIQLNVIFADQPEHAAFNIKAQAEVVQDCVTEAWPHQAEVRAAFKASVENASPTQQMLSQLMNAIRPKAKETTQ